MARIARRQLEGRHLLFGVRISAELDKPKRAPSKMNLTSMDHGGKHVLAMFLN